MLYTWNGTSFSSGVLPSQFLISNTNNVTYFYEQNYQGFFVTSSNYQYVSGQYNPIGVATGTVFTDAPQLSGYVSQFQQQLLTARLDVFQKNAQNALAIFSQTPSSYVATTITQGISALTNTPGATATAFSALQMYAPFLVSPQANFAFQDILNNWPGGASLISSLSGLMSNFQSTITGAVASNQSVIDFKTKLIRQTTVVANQTSKAQQTVNNLLSANTFSALASAFPSGGMNQFQNLLNNHNSALQQQICSLVPVGITGASVEGIVSNFLGGKVFNVLTPLDKLIADVNSANGQNSNLLSSIPTAGFSSLSSMSSFTNQAVNLLSNIVSKIPLTPSVPIPSTITNPQQILNNLTNTASQNLYGKSLTNLSPAQASIAALVNLVATTTSPASSAYNPFTSLVEPILGGFLGNLPVFGNILSQPDPTIQPPNIMISPDPAVVSQQQDVASLQAALDEAAAFDVLPQGDGINIFSAPPLTPRNIPVDGSMGDYNNSVNVGTKTA